MTDEADRITQEWAIPGLTLQESDDYWAALSDQYGAEVEARVDATLPQWVLDCTHDPVCDGPQECADHTDPDHCRICGDPTLRPDRLCKMHDQAAIDSRRPPL